MNRDDPQRLSSLAEALSFAARSGSLFVRKDKSDDNRLFAIQGRAAREKSEQSDVIALTLIRRLSDAALKTATGHSHNA